MQGKSEGEVFDRKKLQQQAWLRRWELMATVARQGSISFAEVREMYAARHGKGDHDQTIRNDMNAIASLPRFVRDPDNRGLRTYSQDVSRDTYYGRSRRVRPEAKQALAMALLEAPPLINIEGDTIVVGPGSTALAVLRVLSCHEAVQILTCNLGVLDEPSVMTPSVLLSGGWPERSSWCLVGGQPVLYIESFGAPTAIVGVSGICYDETERDLCLYCHHEAQRPVKRALIRNRQRVVVVSCKEKVGNRDAWCFGEVRNVLAESDFHLVTDMPEEELPEKIRDVFKPPASEEAHRAYFRYVET